MKLFQLSAGLILLVITLLTGCNSEDVDKQTPFIIGDCRIKRFVLEDGLNFYYFIHYNSEGVPKASSINDSSETAIVNYYKFANQQLTTITQQMFGKDYLVYQYEYGQDGIEVIHRYELESFYDIDGSSQNEVKSYEVSQIQFKYGKSGKPASMKISSVKRDTINNKDISTDLLASDFEYDENGNLVKEINYAPDSNKQMQLSSTYYHKYDEKTNTLKPLHYLIFNVFYSAPYMFSENNKIATKIVNHFETRPEYKYDVEYDSVGNVTKDGLFFSHMVWQCP